MVSVIIPAYNCAKYISKAVESVFEQTYRDLQLIIVNDGSTDDTLKVITELKRQYSDKKFEIIDSKNQGVSTARNIGISKAEGKYVAFLDADDWLEPIAIEVLVELNNKYPDFTISTNIAFIPEQDKDKELFEDKRYRDGIVPIEMSKEEALVKMSEEGFHFQTACSKLYRMDIINENRLSFDTDIAFGEDGLFVYRYLLCTNGAMYYDFMILNVLMRRGSATRAKFNPRWFENARSVQRMIDMSDEYPRVIKAFKEWRVERLYIVMRRYFKESLEKEHYPLVANELKANLSDMLLSNYGIKSKVIWVAMIILPRRIMGKLAKKFD